MTVTLKCDPNVEGGKSTKRVEVIEECNCMSCSVPHTSSEHWYHGHHHQHHQSSGSADAELIKLQAKTNFTSFPTDHEENKRGISHEKTCFGAWTPSSVLYCGYPQALKLVLRGQGAGDDRNRLEILLKVLGGSDDDLTNVDQEALNHILKVITASDHRSTIDHNALDEDDVSQMDGWKKKENLKMDLVKLKEYLATVDHHGDTNQNRHHSRHHIHGPHHSKVLISDDFPNPTLEMEPHHLKPAVGGSEIVYHAESESRGHK
ncbi:hypothetical protein AAG570_005979 [Ranatra chinensis]|uniref:Uncharacterized protein n=1 Tax=Ranatra chinensis TaxID=642074 RepID=A0ABD0XWP0_9HEMI